MAHLNNNARSLAPFCWRQWTWKRWNLSASPGLAGCMVTCCLCLCPCLCRPWSRGVLSRCTNGPLAPCGFVVFSRRMCAFWRYSLLQFHNSSEFFTFHLGLIPRGLCVCIRSGTHRRLFFLRVLDKDGCKRKCRGYRVFPMRRKVMSSTWYFCKTKKTVTRVASKNVGTYRLEIIRQNILWVCPRTWT